MRNSTEHRIRFNWGFHDGTADAAANRRPLWDGKQHYDPVYAKGYEYGRNEYRMTGKRSPTSSDAWNAYKEAGTGLWSAKVA
jgi:hypothetical protein